MSKPKKNQKKTPQAKAAAAAASKKPERKKADPKTVKTVLITLAAAAVVAAIVLLAVFVIKPAIEEHKNKKPDNTVTTAGTQDEGDDFVPVDYKGLSIPGTFADILKEAEAERDALCGKYGVALEIGDIKISRPEFNMYYYDQYIQQYYDVQNSIQNKGANLTGFDPSKTPEEQKYPQGDGTWADYFTYEAIERIQKTYSDFERACKAGTELEEDGIVSLIDDYDIVKNGAEKDGLTDDEHMADMYTEGVDFSMFFARVIMDSFASQYRTDEKQRLSDSYTEQELKAVYDKNPMIYKVAKVRVYMIEGEYNAAEAAAVKNEQEFLEYANKNYPHGEYDADLSTDFGWIAYSDLEAYHGETVANWAFSSDRVAGEVGVVEDFLARYIVYVDVPAFDSYTYQIVSYRNQHEDLNDHSPSVTEATDFYEVWKTSEQTEEKFRQLAEQSGYLEEEGAVITRYDLDLANWFSDPARKHGDTIFYDGSDAAYVVYFLRANTEDLDWKKTVKSELSEKDFEEQFKTFAEKEYNPTINESQMKQSYKTVNARAKRFIETNSK